MNDYLVFTLASAFGAMGDLAGHERRGTLPWPGRSAILGLLGAALAAWAWIGASARARPAKA